MKTLLPKVFTLFILVFLTSKYLVSPIFSENNPRVVINEIQIAGSTASDEFVELYNQTDQNQTLTNWKLKKKSQSGTELTLATFSNTIPAHGYLLFGHTNYDGSVLKNVSYASAIGNNNTILLYDQNDLVIDKVGMGEPFESEGSSAPEPNTNTSIERINHQDTDNNAADFVINNSPNPQNSLSPIDQPLTTPSPTIQPSSSPEISPSATPVSSVFPSPTLNPSLSPNPTVEPSATPKISPSPTIIPSISPSPIISPSISPTPTVSPTPIPSDRILFQGYNILCTLKYELRFISWFSFYLPKVTCVFIK